MTFQTKKCPHCGKIYERNRYAGNPSKYNRTKYGSPVKFCNNCKKNFLDNEYREIAIDGPRRVDTMRISPAGIIYGFIGLIFGVVFLVYSHVLIGIIAIVGGLFVPLSELLSYNKRKTNLEMERIASETRLKNPLYAVTLKRLGYNVPSEYLNFDYNNIKK